MEGGPVAWPHMYRTEQTTGPDRLAIAPREEPLEVMCELAEAIGPEYFVLYVHSVARSDSLSGRFESPPLQLVDVRIFVAEYSAALENDARHEFWIGSTADSGMLVYDDHGLIYAYGPLGDFERSLSVLGFRSGEFSIPNSHHFHAAYDEDVRRLLHTGNGDTPNCDRKMNDDGPPNTTIQTDGCFASITDWQMR